MTNLSWPINQKAYMRQPSAILSKKEVKSVDLNAKIEAQKKVVAKAEKAYLKEQAVMTKFLERKAKYEA